MEVGDSKKPVRKASWRLKLEAGLNIVAFRLLVIVLILAVLFVYSWFHLKVGAH